MSQPKIYVGNLSYNVTAAQLNDFFTQFGEISEVKLISDRETGRSKGFAFITFANQQSADKAVEEADGSEFEGRRLKVNIAKDDARRSGGAGGRFQGTSARDDYR